MTIQTNEDLESNNDAWLGIMLRSAFPGCVIRFWYFISTESSYELSLLSRTSTASPLTNLFSAYRQTNGWTRVDVDLSESLVVYQLIIESSSPRDSSGLGSIAIDDISFTPECSIQPDLELPTITTNAQTTDIIIQTTTTKISDKETEATISKSSNLGLIFGIGVPCLLLVAGALCGAFYLKKKRLNNNSATGMSGFSFNNLNNE